MHAHGHWIAISAALVASTGWSTAAPTDPRSIHIRGSKELTWGPCPSRLDQTMTCATYSVPLDWSQLDGETIELGMAKLSARDPSRRIGYLFINPGGPGNQASGSVSNTARSPTRLDPELLDRFDLIGLDPRGVGLSTPLQCDLATFNQRVDYFPETQTAFDAMVAHNQAAGASCLAKSGRLVHFMDTISVARDIEAVRLALGGEKLSFAGLSYGSQLYAQYAELFPNGVRALLLDGALQHSQGEVSNLLIESTGYETTLRVFFAWCRGDPTCLLTEQDPQAVFLAAVARAEAGPIPAPGCDGTACRRDVDLGELYYAVQGYLGSADAWGELAQALTETAGGNATLFSEELQTGDVYADSVAYAERAVLCQDWTHGAVTLAELRVRQGMGTAFFPLTRGHSEMARIQAYCVGWPAAVTNPPRPLRNAGSAPVLLVNAVYDPSTSYAWAVGMAEELANTVLLTRNGTGHTSFYNIDGETAAAEAAYLLNLTMPAPGTVLST